MLRLGLTIYPALLLPTSPQIPKGVHLPCWTGFAQTRLCAGSLSHALSFFHLSHEFLTMGPLKGKAVPQTPIPRVPAPT